VASRETISRPGKRVFLSDGTNFTACGHSSESIGISKYNSNPPPACGRPFIQCESRIFRAPIDAIDASSRASHGVQAAHGPGQCHVDSGQPGQVDGGL